MKLRRSPQIPPHAAAAVEHRRSPDGGLIQPRTIAKRRPVFVGPNDPELVPLQAVSRLGPGLIHKNDSRGTMKPSPAQENLTAAYDSRTDVVNLSAISNGTPATRERRVERVLSRPPGGGGSSRREDPPPLAGSSPHENPRPRSCGHTERDRRSISAQERDR